MEFQALRFACDIAAHSSTGSLQVGALLLAIPLAVYPHGRRYLKRSPGSRLLWPSIDLYSAWNSAKRHASAASASNSTWNSVLDYENFIEDGLESPLQEGVGQKQFNWIAAHAHGLCPGKIPTGNGFGRGGQRTEGSDVLFFWSQSGRHLPLSDSGQPAGPCGSIPRSGGARDPAAAAVTAATKTPVGEL